MELEEEMKFSFPDMDELSKHPSLKNAKKHPLVQKGKEFNEIIINELEHAKNSTTIKIDDSEIESSNITN